MHTSPLTALVTTAALLVALAPAATAADSGEATTPVDHSQTTIVGPDDGATRATAQAASSCTDPCFTFNGRGSFHSIGMSQYGAFEQAAELRTADQILRSYYSGTTVERRTVAFPIKVAVVRDSTRVRLIARGGPATVFHRDAAGNPQPNLVLPTDAAWAVTVKADGRCTVTGTNAPAEAISCPAFDPSARLEVQEPSGSGWESLADAREYGRGSVVRVLADQVGTGWRLDTVVALPVEEYLYGLAEVPYSWPSAALQTQAIAGRSYALHRMINRGPDPDAGCSCHVWDSMQDQVYAGHDREVSAQWARWRDAVDATAGRAVIAARGVDGYGDTAEGVVQTFYSASSHGRTENKHEVFFPSPWAYMRTVEDGWSLEADGNPYASWRVQVPASTVATRVGMTRVDSIRVTERRESGSAKTVEFRGSTTKTYTADQVRGMFGLLSNGFGIGSEVWGDPPPPSDLFPDDDGSPHEDDIDWLANEGITVGCNPPDFTLFCPDRAVTRGQMAAFLVRALDLPPGSGTFEDTAGHTFEEEIAALAKAGITKGCNPSEGNTRYCPQAPVTRAEMASFLQRALQLPDGPRGVFQDVPSGSTHERAIGALRDARITLGCNPADGNTRYCPDDSISRAQMASFLRRALG